MALVETARVKNFLLVLGMIFVFSFVVVFITCLNLNGLSIQEKIEYLSHVFITISVFLGSVAISINAYYTARLFFNRGEVGLEKKLTSASTVEKKIESKISEREISPEELKRQYFYKALEQLGSSQIETRLGAIYALEQIAYTSSDYHWTIMEILSAFIRENAAIEEDESDEEIIIESLKLPTDIQAALTVIGRRNLEQDPEDQKLNLSEIDISGADLSESDFGGADFTGSILQGVMFYSANLAEAMMYEADLESAVLFEANLQEAILYNANLQGAMLRKANLMGAVLHSCDLSEAVLVDADLRGAVVEQANLQRANLYDANLYEATLESSNLTGATLIGANLSGINLMAANLQSCLLSTANLFEAILFGANLTKANLYDANLAGANLIQANFKGATLQDANLCEADLDRTKYLTVAQLESAFGNSNTILPENMLMPAHWLVVEESRDVADSEQDIPAEEAGA